MQAQVFKVVLLAVLAVAAYALPAKHILKGQTLQLHASQVNDRFSVLICSKSRLMPVTDKTGAAAGCAQSVFCLGSQARQELHNRGTISAINALRSSGAWPLADVHAGA